MTKHVRIMLPLDRTQSGHLHLFATTGGFITSMECLGKADNAKAAAKGNPSRVTTEPFGDAPSGTFSVTQLVETGNPELAKNTGLGTHWIPLDPTGGDAGTAKMRGRHQGA